MKMEKMKRSVIIIVLIIQCAFLIYFGGNKESFHIDEVFSYGLSNNNYKPFEKFDADQWYDSDTIKNYLVAENGETFDYGSVFYNQSRDVHPPLFYIILHTVCSVSPGILSKWQGISINIIFFVLTQWILFLLMRDILNDEKKALISICFYGFSAGAVSMVVYVRMYMMLCFFCTLFIYLNHKLLENSRTKLLVFMIINMIFGTLTHYYFYVFAFFVAAFFCITKFLKKEYKILVKYILSMFCSIFISVMIYPSVIEHIFKGSRGVQAFDNLKTNSLLIYFLEYVKIIQNQLGIISIVLLTVILGVIIFGRKRICEGRENIMININWPTIGMMFSASLGYIMVIAKVAPYRADRYVVCIYPILIGVIISLVMAEIGKISDYKKRALFIGICGFVILGTYRCGVNYLYSDFEDNIKPLQELGKQSAFIILEKEWKINGTLVTLIETEEFYTICYDDIDEISEKFLENNMEETLLYISDDYDSVEDVITAVELETGLKNAEHLMSHGYFEIYHLY